MEKFSTKVNKTPDSDVFIYSEARKNETKSEDSR